MAKKRPRNDTHDKIEDLALYRYMVDLTNYMFTVIESFPKKERMGLTEAVKTSTLTMMRDTIIVGVSDEKVGVLERLNYELKYLKVLVRIAFLKKYISEHRLEIWAGKITEADNVVVGWGRRLGMRAGGDAGEKVKEKGAKA